MRHRLRTPAAVVTLAIVAGCAPEASPRWALGRPRSERHTIVNGTRDPRTVLLTEPQIRAVGWLHYAGYPSQAFCTGTLIAPDLVVTARHCTSGLGAGEVGFGVGMEPAQPEAIFGSIGVFPSPVTDAALIRLAEDATARGLAIEPIAVNQRAVGSELVDRPLQAGGFGDTYDAARTGRWFATVYGSQVTADEIVVDGRGLQGICYGDSGSALIDVDAQGDPVALAVESWGDASCVDIDHMARLDTIYDWIEPVIQGATPPDPCQGVPAAGECVGEVARWCRDVTLYELDCAALDATCAYIAEAERYGCTCDAISSEGRCNGNQLESCRRDRLSVQDCAARGQVCGWDSGESRYRCLDSATCRPEDADGRCEGEVAMTCVDGRSSRELCALDGRLCVADSAGARCVAPQVDAGVVDSGPAGPGDGDRLEGGCGCASGRRPDGPGVLALAGLLVVALCRRGSRR